MFSFCSLQFVSQVVADDGPMDVTSLGAHLDIPDELAAQVSLFLEEKFHRTPVLVSCPGRKVVSCFFGKLFHICLFLQIPFHTSTSAMGAVVGQVSGLPPINQYSFRSLRNWIVHHHVNFRKEPPMAVSLSLFTCFSCVFSKMLHSNFYSLQTEMRSYLQRLRMSPSEWAWDALKDGCDVGMVGVGVLRDILEVSLIFGVVFTILRIVFVCLPTSLL